MFQDLEAALAAADAIDAGAHLDPDDDHEITDFLELYPVDFGVAHPSVEEQWEIDAYEADRRADAYERVLGW